MAVLTDHPYASLTLPDDAAADCLFLRPGLPGVPPFLLHRGGGDLPNSQEVREGRSSTTNNHQRKKSQAFLVGRRRDTFSRSPGGTTLSWLQRGDGPGCGFRVSLLSPHSMSSLQALQKLSDVTLVPVSCSELEKAGAGLSSLSLVLSTRPHS